MEGFFQVVFISVKIKVFRVADMNDMNVQPVGHKVLLFSLAWREQLSSFTTGTFLDL